MYSFFRPLHSATGVACPTPPVASSLQPHAISPPPNPHRLCHPDKRLVAGDGFHAVISTNACINLERGRREYIEVCRIRKHNTSREKWQKDKHRVFFP